MQPVVKIEPSILVWARESLGLSIADVATKLDKDVSVIRAWESGKDLPSYGQLEELAYSVYKRPLAVFFLPSPPRESTPRQDFRTLPEQDISKLSRQLRLFIRRTKHHQLVLRKIHDNKNPIERPVFRTFKIKGTTSVFNTAVELREHFGISIELQKRLPDSDSALSLYREAVEKGGVYVFQFPIQDARGFSLMDEEFPVIVLNSADTANSKIFTLIHELCHILFNTGGVLIESLTPDPTRQRNQVEIFCNRFASEFLLPREVLLKEPLVSKNEGKEWSEVKLQELASTYKVSKEVVLRKLLDTGRTTQAFYNKLRKKWQDDYQKAKKISKKGGGNYHNTNLSRLGKNYVSDILTSFHAGKLSEVQVADILGIKINKIKDYEQRIF
jgi:Zn-dependent peptidase ImmA (M78 family)/transcriptional regulator with XRE-family HTH domain